MISRMTPQELREQIAEIARRVNNPTYRACYMHDSFGVYVNDFVAQDDLLFLLDLVDQLSPEYFELTESGRAALDER